MGFTLVELMVATTIGMILLAGLVSIFVSNSELRNELDRGSRLVENGSYAMQMFTDDLRMAGYYAELDVTNAALTMPISKPSACATDLASLKAALPIVIQGYDSAAGLPTSCATVLTDLRSGSDIVLIRRVASCVAGPTAGTGCDSPTTGAPYFQASLCNSATQLGGPSSGWYQLATNLTDLTLNNRDCTTIASYHRFLIHIYFVTNNDLSGDGIPTLKRAELGAAGGITAFSVIPLAEGVENLQLEYGLDTSSPSDGKPDTFTANPDSYNSCVGTDCVTNWLNAVSIKINMLVRNTERSASYTDTKTYVLGMTATGANNTYGPYNDKYRRHVYAATVRLYNPGGRREL